MGGHVQDFNITYMCTTEKHCSCNLFIISYKHLKTLNVNLRQYVHKVYHLEMRHVLSKLSEGYVPVIENIVLSWAHTLRLFAGGFLFIDELTGVLRV